MTTETREVEPLLIMVYDTILVSEALVVGIIVERITTWKVKPNGADALVSVAEYRQLLGDHTSTDKRIAERRQYLEAFCRNIIKPELQKTYEQSKENIIR